MSKLRNLIEQGPALCGAVNAPRFAKIFLHAFDDEISDKASVFSHKDGETIEDRLEILKGLYLASGVNSRKAGYWVDLLTLCAYSYAVAKGREDLAIRRNSLAGMLSTVEGENPDIASVMSVSDASTLTTWL